MAAPARASRALFFMRHCRRSSHISQPQRYSSSEASNSSPYAPSNFTRPAPSRASFKGTDAHDDDSSASFAPSSISSLPSPRPLYAHPKSRAPSCRNPRDPHNALHLAPLAPRFPPKSPATYQPAPFRVTNNPYRARKKWPPDFRNLDSKQQFHFEKTYRRRAALKWARPRWNKGIKLVRHTLITATIIYFVFICEPEHGMGTPFDGFRIWFFDKLGKLGQLPESTREEAGKLREEARQKYYFCQGDQIADTTFERTSDEKTC